MKFTPPTLISLHYISVREWKLNEVYLLEYSSYCTSKTVSAGDDNSKSVMHGTETERLEEPHM